jgi:phosphoribosylaminoimidazole-succinocarboxamide synthase
MPKAVRLRHKDRGDYKMAEKLAEPILTALDQGRKRHDEYVGFDHVAGALGSELANKINEISLRLYKDCGEYALTRA